MYFTTSFAAASIIAFVHGAVIERFTGGLEVTLAAENSGAQVVATVKNTGAVNMNLLTVGTFLDSAPVEKLFVSDASDAAVEFKGVYRTVQYSALTASDFKLLKAGETFTTTINSAAVHDLSTGTYTFVAEGAVPFAAEGSTELSGTAVTFKSNDLKISVDGAETAKVARAFPAMTLAERTVLQSGCSSSQRAATTAALSRCVSLSRAASTAASSGSATKFSEYFKSTSSSVRSTVAARLTAVANQCASLTSGATRYYCTDVYGYCGSNVLAYTIPSQNIIVNCPLYYSALRSLTSTCHAQDQTTTTLHEMTHAPGVYSPGTGDNGYGYAAATSLSSARAVANADSYALFANAIYVGC
ncbi:putative neutral protease 2 like protein [Amylocarpus encephaloides]|uniref:Neutral protease 2 n=1 Tax=Amylocarpus encephaloides TaxID=45428 RepID=A0A9P7YDV7_9HELO|nr:putative neutral protease 2 like protein [Amylocarpus encephaloides]